MKMLYLKGGLCLLLACCMSLFTFAQPTISLSAPVAGAQFTAPANVTLVAQAAANNTFPYLQVSNPGTGWRKLKLGYGDNIWSPAQNVASGGNTTMEIILKDLNGGINWSKIQVRPQGNGTLSLNTYMNVAVTLPNGWKKLTIPMSQFGSSVNFTAISYIEIPYSVNSSAFLMAIRSVRFIGGSAPFEWFGPNHFNNSHDGATQNEGNLLATLQQGTTGNVTLNRVDFFSGNALLGQDFTAPYTYNWLNMVQGTYTVNAALSYNNNVVINSAPVTFTVLPPPTPQVVMVNPQNGYQCYQGTAVSLSANAGVASAPYLQINNPNWGWLKLKLGYDPLSIWYPPNNVLSGGNNLLEITLKDFSGNADWTKLQVRPQGVGTNPVALSGYMSNAATLPDGWKKISIPLTAFSSDVNFQALTFIELPYSINAGPFNIGIAEVKFTGGTTPFLWFGTGKTNNAHDGNTSDSGSLPVVLVSGNLNNAGINNVQFYNGNTLLAEKITPPYTVTYTFDQPGAYAVTARAYYNNNTQWVSSTPANITVLPVIAADTIQLQFTFANAPATCNIQKAPLRYNKKFAFSLTLDDGLADAYSAAYPLLKGGTIAANGYNCPGLYYTDGCGNQLNFTAGAAITSQNSTGQDIHNGSFPEYLTWEQMNQLYLNGWDMLNHSLSHQAGWSGAPLPASVYTDQVVQNTLRVKNQTAAAINMTQFVVPSGDSYYYPYAFANGMKAVYNQFWTPDFQYGLNVDAPLALNNFLLNRNSMEDNLTTLINQIDLVAAQSLTGTHYWWNDFTHSIANFSGPVSGGLQFANFRQYMEHIAANYGANGADNVWAASLQEVYEYLAVREGTVLNWQLNGNQLTATLLLNNVPDSLRHTALTLLVNTDQNFGNVQITKGTGVVYTFNGTAPNNRLINLTWGSGASLNAKTGNTNLPTANAPANVLHLFPNPAYDAVTVSFPYPVTGNCHLKLYNQTGQVVLQQHQQAQGLQQLLLPLGELPAGIYYLQCTGENAAYETVKVVKCR